MEKTKKILMIIILALIMLIPTKSMASVAEYDWTDPETNIQFKISVDESGKITANPVGEKTWLDNITDYKKYREALVRAQVQGAVMNKNGTTEDNNKSEEQEERKETTTTTGTVITPNNPRDTSKINKGSLGWGGNLFCLQHYNNNIAEGEGKNKIIVAGMVIDLSSLPREGIKIGQGKTPQSGTITATPTQPSQGMVADDARYTVESRETVGKTYESAAIAYIVSRVNDANDNGNKLENYMQIAIWDDDYFGLNGGQTTGRFTNGLLEEAKAYQAYRKEVEEWKSSNGTIKDGIIDKNVSTDIKNGVQKLGPYTLEYVRGYSNIQGREFVDFGGIQEMMLYNQDGNEIPADAWKIEFKSNRQVDEADKEYLSKFPASGEEFYIVLDIDKLPAGTTKLSKIAYKYRGLHITADVEIYKGTVTKVDKWIKKSTVINRQRVPTGPNSWKWETTYEYRIVPILIRVEGQKTMLITKIYRDEDTTTLDVPSIQNPPYRLTIPTNWPNWPHWPNYPDYPDYPDRDLTFTIAGIVWEDEKTGKESNFDGKIGTANSGEQEKGMQNVEVKLYKHGSSDVIKTTYTDSNGAYVFNEIPVGRYDVGFVYDGLTYKTTKSFASGSAEDYVNNPNDEKYELDSKAEETEADRQNFNNKFYEITAQGAKNSAGTITNTEALEYETSNGVSKIKTTYSDGKVKKDFQLETKTSNTLSVGYPFSDYVNNADTSKVINGQTYAENYKYMAYVNLGLQKRPEVDFALTKDVYTSTVTINNKQIDYKYNARAADSFDIGIKQSVAYSGVKYNREVYKSDYNYRIDDYKKNQLNEVNGADIRGLKSEDQELKVFVTYKIKVRNQSEIYSGTINQLVDYFDSKYTLISEDKKLTIRNDGGTMVKDKVVARAPYFETQNGTQGNLTVSSTESYDNNYNKVYISGIQNNILQSGEDIYLYLTFEVNKNSTRAVELGEKNNQVEITSYSTFDQNATTKDKTVGMIDRDSAPGNLDPENSATLEDDSDIAPTINVKLYEGATRTINGLVWEDERTKTIKETSQIVGDGVRQDKETKVDGVIVQLIEKITAENGQEYEYIWQEMYTGESGYKYIDINGNIFDSKIGTMQSGKTDIAKGEYKFSGYIPGDYIVRFIYGQDDKTVLTSKNAKSYNGQDYKSTAYHEGNNVNEEWYDLSSAYLNNTALSDAKDNEARRLKVMDYSKVMKNDVAKVLASHEKDYYNASLHKTLEENTWMYADTAKMRAEVEYNTTQANGTDSNSSYNIRDIDFGLEQRPTAKISLTKNIEEIKITLANGTTLIDTGAGIRKNVNWVKKDANKGTQGIVHIYMDEEVMQGANVQIKYKITVKNNSQVDTTGATAQSVGTTYYTGKYSSTDKIVTTSIDLVSDYMDNSIVYRTEENNGNEWNAIENTAYESITKMEDAGYLDKNVGIENKNIHKILLNEKYKNDKLKPGESRELELLLTKTISSSDTEDDLSYDNIAEILQYTNSVGRRADLPGNQDPKEDGLPKEADADRTETVVITPPTGENRSHYFVLAGVILVVTAVGIFVIKKKVLDK